MDSDDDAKIAKGFDRGVSFPEIKSKLLKSYDSLHEDYECLDESDRYYNTRKKKILTKIIYTTIALIQLNNGSRTSESCKAFLLFMNNKNFKEKVVVKIAKSKSTKYNRKTKEKYVSKARFRKMKFPDWIKIKYYDELKEVLDNIDHSRLMKRVLDYLLLNFNCNTHSLRYSFINHMLYEKKKEANLVAKFVGHVNTNQLTRYTQQKETDKMFDMDL